MADAPPKKNAAYTLIFPLYDNTGSYKSGASPSVSISKDGGSFNASSNSPTEIGSTGVYTLAVTSTEMNADRVVFKITASGARDTFGTLATVTRQLTDLAFPNTSGRGLDVNASGDADAVLQSVAAGAITSSAFAANALGAVWDELVGNHTTANTVGEAILPIGGQGISINTAQAGSASTITLAASANANDSYYNDMVIAILSSTGSAQARLITGYVGSTKVATVSPNWVTAPDSTSRYRIFPFGRADLALVLGSAINALVSGRVDASVGAVASGAIAAASLASDLDVYTAKVTLTDDNSGTADRYTVVWFKNGIPQTSGISSPTIQVVKASDGSDLVASTAMTQIGSTGAYRYTESTNRVADGAAYFAKVTATIDSATRTWEQPVSRDSS